jgi:CysZ protein
MMSLGFGLAVMISTVLPLVNFVIMPAAVAGATVMWIETRKK